MTHVKLMGEIGQKFGTDWDMDVSNFRDMFRLIECQTEGFKQYLLNCADNGINFTIQNGEDLIDGTLDAMIAPVRDTVIITPVAAGAGGSDVLKVVIGAVLLYFGVGYIEGVFSSAEAAAATEYANAVNQLNAGVEMSEAAAAMESSAKAMEFMSKAGAAAARGVQALGISLGMEGITGYLTPDTPSEAGKSYLYDGPENNVLQGAPVPLLYGELLVGGSVINFAFVENQITTLQKGYTQIKDGYYGNSAAGGGYGDGNDDNGGDKYGIEK